LLQFVCNLDPRAWSSACSFCSEIGLTIVSNYIAALLRLSKRSESLRVAGEGAECSANYRQNFICRPCHSRRLSHVTWALPSVRVFATTDKITDKNLWRTYSGHLGHADRGCWPDWITWSWSKLIKLPSGRLLCQLSPGRELARLRLGSAGYRLGVRWLGCINLLAIACINDLMLLTYVSVWVRILNSASRRILLRWLCDTWGVYPVIIYYMSVDRKL